MRITKVRTLSISVLVSLVVLPTLLFVISPVFAEVYQNVHVLVAYDEEFDHTARSVYWYSPETLCSILVGGVSDRFKSAFDIKFTVIRYVSWDSDDSVTDDMSVLLHECIDETGFYSGMTYNTIPIDILIVFTDQTIMDGSQIIYGCCALPITTGAVIVTETYYYFSLGQCADNILQHELSHMYGCEDHLNRVNCTMSLYPEDNPIYGHRPYGFYTESWCTGCRNTINENREMWGREQTVGGGGCPTLLVWNGSDYVDYGVIDIHNPFGKDVVKEVPVQAEDMCINRYKAKFKLREGWPGLNYSESVIDQVKLYAVDNDGNHHLCSLIRATHSSLGNVLLKLLASDDHRVRMLLLERIDLTFIIPYRNVQSFTLVIEGCNIEKEY